MKSKIQLMDAINTKPAADIPGYSSNVIQETALVPI